VYKSLRYTASFHCGWLKIVSSWPTLAADHCNLLWCQRQLGEHEMCVSWRHEFFRRGAVSVELSACRITWRWNLSCIIFDNTKHFGLSMAAALSDCCFFAPCIYTFSYLPSDIHRQKFEVWSCGFWDMHANKPLQYFAITFPWGKIVNIFVHYEITLHYIEII